MQLQTGLSHVTDMLNPVQQGAAFAGLWHSSRRASDVLYLFWEGLSVPLTTGTTPLLTYWQQHRDLPLPSKLYATPAQTKVEQTERGGT